MLHQATQSANARKLITFAVTSARPTMNSASETSRFFFAQMVSITQFSLGFSEIEEKARQSRSLKSFGSNLMATRPKSSSSNHAPLQLRVTLQDSQVSPLSKRR